MEPTVLPLYLEEPTILSSYKSEDFYFDHIYAKKAPEIVLHTHDILELIFFKKGNASYIVEGKTYPLSRNSLILSHPAQNHYLAFDPGSEYERYDMILDDTKLPTDIYQRISRDISVVNLNGNTLVSDIFKKFDYYCENLREEDLGYLLMRLTEEVLYNVLLATAHTQQSNLYTVNPSIYKAVTYIEHHITQPISIDAICDELYLTKSHLHQLFTKHLQTSPKKYILTKKLMLAQRELRIGKKPTEVYLTCGFTDYSTFFRDYKNYFGHAPSDEINSDIVRRIQS